MLARLGSLALVSLTAMGCCFNPLALPGAPTGAPIPGAAPAPIPMPSAPPTPPMAPMVATPVPAAPAAATGVRRASDGELIPEGGCEYRGIVYEATGELAFCLGGGNGCGEGSEVTHVCTPADVVPCEAGSTACVSDLPPGEDSSPGRNLLRCVDGTWREEPCTGTYGCSTRMTGAGLESYCGDPE